jgi:hypothetical protein
MVNSNRDLWPDNLSIAGLRAPVTILREQAGFLSHKTKHLVEGLVKSKTSDNHRFSHDFYLVAPALDRYRFLLLSIEHDTDFYPLKMSSESNPETTVNSEEELMTKLAQLFSSEKTQRVIHALLAQSQEDTFSS